MTAYEAHVISSIVELLDMEDDSEISAQTSLEDDLGIDSGLLLELFMLLEEKLPNLEIDPAQLRPEQFTSVASFAKLVESCVKEEVAA